MKTFRFVSPIILAFLLCFATKLCSADDIIFHKVFENGSSVEVVNHPPVLYTTTVEEQAMLDKWRKSIPPGTEVGFMPYNYYRTVDFIYRKNEKQKPVLLCQMTTSQYSIHDTNNDLNVFDAINFKDKIYFLLHFLDKVGAYSFTVDGGGKKVNILTAIVTAADLREEYRESAGMMTRDATFTRTPDGYFTASLYKDDGDVSFWKFDGNKWVRAELPAEELLSQDVTVKGERWHLALTRESTVGNVSTPEDPAMRKGKRYLFTKTRLPAQAAPAQVGQVSQPVVIWDLFQIAQSFDTEFRPKWSAAAVVNAEKNEITLALTNRRDVCIQTFDWDGQPLKGVAMEPLPIQPTFLQELIGRFIEPDKAMASELPWVDTLSLAQKGDELQLQVSDTTRKITQTWAISLADRDSPFFKCNWKKIAETRLEKTPVISLVPTVPNP